MYIFQTTRVMQQHTCSHADNPELPALGVWVRGLVQYSFVSSSITSGVWSPGLAWGNDRLTPPEVQCPDNPVQAGRGGGEMQRGGRWRRGSEWVEICG
ncbi:hypothetical protein Pmani_022057 [Petrolisthes manimaculis]|uniref:Uncharacterized protein n=1 Tax=Petrolisthes manimaculis TaxID=1843537 RepID=A0AAE1U1J7_9EUCA|nr:hypothetical protein Pmani_022057 [Petrolisthes manimaculis]